jgi:hypothetical protein
MNRRQLLLAAAATALARPALAADIRTRWNVRTSEGFDALCFVGPLSGKPFYADYYKDELAAFKPLIAPAALAALADLQAQADRAGSLLGPDLTTIFSGGPDATLDDLIASLDAAERVLAPPLQTGPYAMEPADWQAFLTGRPKLRQVLTGLKDAGFPAFRKQYVEPRAAVRLPALTAKLAGMDVIAEQERLLGRRFPDPSLEVILLYFSKPHGIKIQGQRFLTHLDYPDQIVIRNAAHEMLHPPFPMDGPLAKTVLERLGRDALLTRIVAEHDPAFGYNSLEGILNEDTVQALEEIIAGRLGVGAPPAKRWRMADGGMHVLAAGLYGLLMADGYDRTGGNIETWFRQALDAGRLDPGPLHASAAGVLGLPADKLWPSTPIQP